MRGKRVMDVLKDQIHDLKEVREWGMITERHSGTCIWCVRSSF